MIEVIDRIPMYPGRVRLIPVAGQENTYDMVRADEPIEPGTPINRALFQSFVDDMNAIRQRVDDTLFELSHRIRVGDLSDGTVFGLRENGVLVPFIKLSSNYKTEGRILAVRKDCVTEDVLMNVGDTFYENSKTDLWLNNEYLSTLDTMTQSVLSTVKIEVFNYTSTKSIYRKVFLIALSEYGLISTESITTMGASLSYFSSAERRTAMLNGVLTNHWTRSHDTENNIAAYITADGEHLHGLPRTFVAGIRPALTLPDDFEVTVGVPSTENVMATAEVL